MKITVSEFSKKILTITLVYTFAHFMLWFVSGYLWDDSSIWNTPDLRDVYRQTGSMVGGFFTYLVVWLPGWTFRIAVFFEYLLDAILVFLILGKMDFLTEKEAFWISLIYAIIPTNDARILIICHGYTTCLLLFWIAFYLTILSRQTPNRTKHIILRCISLALLFLCFNTESLLVYAGLIILYLYYFDLKKYAATGLSGRALWKKLPVTVLKNIDYVAVIFIWKFIKNTWFRPFGFYEDYNQITVSALIKAVITAPRGIYTVCKLMVKNYIKLLNVWSVVACVVLICVFIAFAFYSKMPKKSLSSRKRSLGMIILGLIVFEAGMYPYTVVRNNYWVSINGVFGRDSMLLALGTSLLIYFGLEFVFGDFYRVRIMLYTVCIMFGILHFNRMYSEYQKDWFHIEAFGQAVLGNEEIYNNDSFYVIEKTNYVTKATRFYSLNFYSKDITGDDSRCFTTDLQYIYDEPTYAVAGYGMGEYVHDEVLDGIIVLDMEDISYGEMLKMRFYEAFDTEKYNQMISEKSKVSYVPVSREISEQIKKDYASGIADSSYMNSLLEQLQQE